MRNFYKLACTLLIALIISISLLSQNRFFTDAGENSLMPTTGQRYIIPKKFRASALDVASMKSFLWSLPPESAIIRDHNRAQVMELPMPDGRTAKFRVWESSIMAPALAAKFPEMRTFAGQGIDDPYATIRFDYNPYFGFSAQILSTVTGRIFIDAYARTDIKNYISYYARDAASPDRFICDMPTPANRSDLVNAGPCRGTQLFTYRLALACTGEYAVAVCAPNPATVPATSAAMLVAVNRVTGVYENEASIRMVLVPNNDLLIFLDGTTDPYTNNNGGAMLTQNINTCNAVIGINNYDIGHVFSTGGGGVAFLGVICTANKAGGVTGLPNPVGDAFYIDYVAHEMGHQYGGNHTFNSQTGSCGGGNRNASTAYEVGSGTTIQAYAGICGSDDIQPNSDPFFHTVSFDEISNYAAGTGGTCAAQTATGNSIPVITAMNNNGANIPLSTPFTLSAAATDANGDPLTYCWEEWDLGPAGAWNSGASSTTAPLFKSRVPKTVGERTFPDIAVILAGYPANPPATMGGLKGETLPTVARAIKFRLTVRDNRAGGGGVVTGGDGCGTFTSQFQVNTIAGTGPFVVTAPNGGENYTGGSTQTITWNVAGTSAAPISTANVKISLSTDGGLTYPTVIIASTPNDGTEALTIPSVATVTARIKIEAVGNIFFDISNANFTISIPTGFSFDSPAPVVSSCPAPATMQTTLTATYIPPFTNPITLSATVNPSGPTVSFGTNPLTPGTPSSTVILNNTNTLSPGNYVVTVTGTASGAPTQTRDITFTINPGAGPTINTQPANQTVCVGSNATFTVSATGATSYQWQVSTNACATWTNIANGGVYSGATTATLTLTAPPATMSTYGYRVLVNGLCGTSTSAPCAVLTVNTAPAITTQPGSVAVCSGSAVSFTVAGTGSGLTFQWELSIDNGATWNPIAGATAATYNIASTTTGQNGYRYRCVISGACPPSATSAAAILTVSSSITITTNPSNVTLCEGLNTSFTVAASGSGLTYQWQLSTDGGTNYNNIANGGVYSGATTPTLTITGVLPGMNTYRYRCVVSNPPCSPGTSTAAILTVNTFPVITGQPQNATVCEGAGNTFSVTATTGVGVLSYQWQVSTDGGTTYNNITGATNSTLPLTLVTVGANGYRYRVIVTAGCGSVTSTAAIFTVNSYPVITLGLVPAVVCQSDPALTLSGSPAGGAFSGAGISGSTFTPSTAGVGAASVTYTATNAGCTSVSTRVIRVNECAERHLRLNQFPAVIVYPIPSSGIINIRINTDLYTRIGVKAYNSSGQMVDNRSFNGIAYGSVVSVDLSRQAAGVYHLFLFNDENGQVDKKGVSVVVYR